MNGFLFLKKEYTLSQFYVQSCYTECPSLWRIRGWKISNIYNDAPYVYARNFSKIKYEFINTNVLHISKGGVLVFEFRFIKPSKTVEYMRNYYTMTLWDYRSIKTLNDFIIVCIQTNHLMIYNMCFL